MPVPDEHNLLRSSLVSNNDSGIGSTLAFIIFVPAFRSSQIVPNICRLSLGIKSLNFKISILEKFSVLGQIRISLADLKCLN